MGETLTPPSTRVRVARRVRAVPIEVLGLVAAVVVFLSIATTYAFQTPPFLAPDETAHLGYAHEIASFDLPTIETRPAIPASATQWLAERDSRADDRYRAVWVANHPPLNYAAVVPLIWLSDLTDRADGGLMYLRLANVAFAAVGVVMTYLFALEVTGGRRRVALGAASLTAFLPQGHGLFSEALNDGLGFAAGGFVLWAAARCVRRGAPIRDLRLLGAAVVVGWSARASTMLMATVVVALVAAFAGVTSRGRWRSRLRAAVAAAAIGIGPAVVLVGWFYARNVHLYGDIGGSEFLLDRFNRSTRGGVLSMMTQGHRWVDLYHMLLSPSPLFSIKAPAGTNPAAIGAVIGIVVAVVVGRTGDGNRWRSFRPSKPGAGSNVSRLALAIGLVSVAVIAFTVAQHLSGGGNAYARYLFPVLPTLATAAAIGYDRIVPRLGPAIAIAALGLWAWRNVPTAVDLAAVTRPRDRGRPMPDALRVTPSSAWSRDVLMVLGIAGTVVLAVVILVGVASPVVGVLRRSPGLQPGTTPTEERSALT